MPDLLVRDVDPTTIERLKRQAAAGNRSLQAEARRILEQAARAADPTAAREVARRIEEALGGRTLPDSTPMIRAERDA